MIFNSLEFGIFFLLTTLVFYFLPARLRWIWLLLAGIVFYSWSNVTYILVPAFIILVTYFGGLKIEKAASEKKVRFYFLLCIGANIGILVFFKYTNFFTSTAVDFLNFCSQNIFHSTTVFHNSLLITLLAPLGISYITFQAIGYLVEIKRGNHSAEKHLGHFSTYLLFFPKIIAGPVERAHHFLPQLKTSKAFDYNNLSGGIKLVIWGLFKKLVIADRISIYTNVVFNNFEHHSGITLTVTAILYVFQMYADFSGYTDMALGIARILGFDLAPNFNRPLLAKSVTEFWRKWHISLSSWFTDYFYNPIVIEKRDWGKWAVIVAFFVTFITLGFWHGASWTFIIFGLLQAVILSIEFFTRKTRKELRKKIPPQLNNLLGTGFTFGFFAFATIFFRAESIGDSFAIIKKILSFKGPIFLDTPSMIIFIAAGVFYLAAHDIKKEYFNNLFTFSGNKNWLIRNGYYCMLIIIILLSGVFDGGQFIYFQF